MSKYLILILAVIFVSLALMYFFIGVAPIDEGSAPAPKTAHFYGQPGQSISRVKIVAFYFIPKNKQELLITNWQKVLTDNLTKLQKFHGLQLQGRSEIIYEIYPRPVVGLENNLFYDTNDTQFGNPQALRSIAQELGKRVFDRAGDLYLLDFAKATAEGEYQSIVIMYQGVGASGSDNTALISSTFLTKDEYKGYGASILAHEFYHTLGVPEGYEVPSSISFTSDVMGLGRLKPIDKTFLNQETIKQLGL